MSSPTSPPQTSHSNPTGPASKAAIWSLVLGILSFVIWLLGSIPAIVLGIVGIKKANADPQRFGGKGLAIAGIVTGSLGLIIGGVSAILISAAIPAYNGVRERATEMEEIVGIKNLALACQMYAADSDGNYPPALSDLYPKYVDDKDLLVSVKQIEGEAMPYLYRSGFTKDSDGKEPLILSPSQFNKHSPVAYVDGTVKSPKGDELAEIRQLFE